MSDIRDKATWRAELTALLSGHGFPARLADVIGHLHQAQAPSRLLWRLSSVPTDAKLSSLDALIAELDARSSRVRDLPAREPI